MGGYSSQPDLVRTIRAMQSQISALQRSTQQQRIPIARVVRSSDFTLPNNTETMVSWDVATFDTTGMFDAAHPTRLTVSYRGVYHVDAQVLFSTTGGVVPVSALISVSGNNRYGAEEDLQTASASIGFSPSATLLCEDSDYIELQLYQASGAPMNVIRFTLYLSVFWIGVA